MAVQGTTVAPWRPRIDDGEVTVAVGQSTVTGNWPTVAESEEERTGWKEAWASEKLMEAEQKVSVQPGPQACTAGEDGSGGKKGAVGAG